MSKHHLLDWDDEQYRAVHCCPLSSFFSVPQNDFLKAACNHAGQRRPVVCVVYGSVRSAVWSAHVLMPAHARLWPLSGSPFAQCSPGKPCSVESSHKASAKAESVLYVALLIQNAAKSGRKRQTCLPCAVVLCLSQWWVRGCKKAMTFHDALFSFYSQFYGRHIGHLTHNY